MKHFLLTLLCLFTALNVYADQKLTFKLATGKEEVFLFSENPEITFSGDYINVKTTTVETSYLFSLVSEYTIATVPSNDEPETPGDDPETPGDDPETPGDDPETPGDDPETPGDDPETPGDDPENPGETAIKATNSDVFVFSFINNNVRVKGCSYVKLYSIDGRMVMSQIVDGDANISLSNLTNGIYLLKTDVKTIKLLKK